MFIQFHTPQCLFPVMLVSGIKFYGKRCPWEPNCAGERLNFELSKTSIPSFDKHEEAIGDQAESDYSEDNRSVALPSQRVECAADALRSAWVIAQRGLHQKDSDHAENNASGREAESAAARRPSLLSVAHFV